MSSISVNTITDASGGSTTSINGFTPSVSNMAGRNRIINGGMVFDQRNAGASVTASGSCVLDRFIAYRSGGAYTVQRSATAPAGFVNSMLMTNTTPASPTTYSFFGQIIEGNNIADLGFGTTTTNSVTVSFWVNSSVTGIYSISLTNGNGDRAYAVQYTINAANTWEYKTITAPVDTTGTWATNNTSGLFLRVNLGSPSARLISAGSWQVANADGATGSTGADTWANTSGATFYITGVQLEEGSVATPFEHRQYGQELALCQRYYWQVSGVSGSTTGCTIDGLYSNGSGAGIFYSFMHPVTMRTAPTATVNYNDLTNASSVVVTTSIYGANVSANGGTTSSGRTGFTFNSTGFVKMSAEL